MKKTLNQISALVPNEQNYKNVANKLDFDSFQAGFYSKQSRKKPLFISIIVFAIICILASALIPTFLNVNYLGHDTSAEKSNQMSQIRLLKKNYIEQAYMPSTTSNDDVTKINTWLGFEEYSSKIRGFDTTDFSGEIDESLFDNSCLLGIKFASCSMETSSFYDGKGVVINELKAINNKLFIRFSIPKKGFDEAFHVVTFFAIAPKDVLTDDFEYNYEIIQRDTGEKGSSHYDENGNKR